MKTKLLKKVRKTFAIHRCDELATNADVYERRYKKKFGLPFYYITDKDYDTYYFSWYSWENRVFTSYSDALTELIDKVHRRYFERFKHKDMKTTKVWSVNNKKTK